MAPKQTISFTALPNGVFVTPDNKKKVRLSVYIAPRLADDSGSTTSMNLSSFGDWVDWPNRDVSFKVQFTGGPELAATPVGDPPSAQLWGMLFGGTTSLVPHEFEDDLADTKIPITYAVKAIHEKIQEIYRYFAKNNPEEFPTVSEILASPLNDFTSLFLPAEKPQPPCPQGYYWDDATQSCQPKLTAVKGPGLAAFMAAPQVQQDFKAVQDFHKPFNPNNRVTPVPPDIDFHQMLSALGRYPYLMRRLGIVRDLVADHPGPVGNVTVQVNASWSTKAGSTVPVVKTNCVVSDTAFYARPRAASSELSGDGLGMLRFDDADEYDLVQVNQDGAAMKTLNFVSSVIHATFDIHDPTNYPDYELKEGYVYPSGNPKTYKTDDTPMSYSIPSLNSIGLAIARVDRAKKTEASLQIQKAKNDNLEKAASDPDKSVEFDAEDLVRGYAIDVQDNVTGKWHSLCERVGTYRFGATTLSGIADEGWVSTGLAKPADGSSDDAKLQETLFNWHGWSFSAPRPGKTMDENGNPVYTQNEPTGQFNLKVDFVAKPGSLPKLRYGTTYRLRARAVDLAGNRTPREAVAGLANASGLLTYGRFDPVASPEAVPSAPLAEGDGRERLVIRSNYATKADTAIRHIAPPKAAETMAETLGNLDGTNGGLDADAYKLLQQKDGGSWTDIGKLDPNNPGVYYVTEESSAILPYLPDLLSRGATLRELPGSSGPVKVPFYDKKEWPDALPFDLVLGEGAGAPQFQSGPRDLNVQLGKADVATIRVSSYMGAADVDRMGLLRWLEANSSQVELNSFRQRVQAGSHWMVTPFRELTLVHAVRQPLLRPKFTSLAVSPARALANTFATLTDADFVVSRKSTSRVDILAQWTETMDTAPSGPVVVQGSARPFQVKVELDPSSETKLNLTGKHEFHDTKHRQVKYWADATSRFAEYFAERKTRMQVHSGQAVKLHPTVVDAGVNWGGVVDGSETVTAADRTTRYVRGTDYTMDYELGTFTAAAGLDGKTVVITYVPTPVVRRTETPTELDILSTARPAAPKVLYLIPTFGWSSAANQAGTEYKSERKGGGLRAYLDRPWFSSGDGEMLGVVIWTGAWPPDETTTMYVSDWGLDSLYKSVPTTQRPTVSAFTRATPDTTTQFSLEELQLPTAPHTFHVAAHPVAYDAQRKLWYADIEIDAGPSYTPFVRLALARYQPHSVKDAHLSRVVLADFVQLTANRAASLTRPSKQSDTLTIAVSGLSYQQLNSGAGPSTVEVSLERRRANTEPDKQAELAWEAVPASTKALTPSGPAGTTIWSGQVTLPKNMGDRFRIVIQEFERFSTTPTDRRLVYADAIEIDR
jgi:hypothetical protein